MFRKAKHNAVWSKSYSHRELNDQKSPCGASRLCSQNSKYDESIGIYAERSLRVQFASKMSDREIYYHTSSSNEVGDELSIHQLSFYCSRVHQGGLHSINKKKLIKNPFTIKMQYFEQMRFTNNQCLEYIRKCTGSIQLWKTYALKNVYMKKVTLRDLF